MKFYIQYTRNIISSIPIPAVLTIVKMAVPTITPPHIRFKKRTIYLQSVPLADTSAILCGWNNDFLNYIIL